MATKRKTTKELVYFIPRKAARNCPAGWTVTKNPTLPKGDFRITEHTWGSVTLWFVDADKFTADERQRAYYLFVFAHWLRAMKEGK